MGLKFGEMPTGVETDKNGWKSFEVECGGKVGWGMFEYCFMGTFEGYGIDNPLFWHLKL